MMIATAPRARAITAIKLNAKQIQNPAGISLEDRLVNYFSFCVRKIMFSLILKVSDLRKHAMNQTILAQ